MTEAELLTALRESQAAPPGQGNTVDELVTATGWSDRAVRKCLKAGIKHGSVWVSTKRVPDMTGRLQVVPSYVFTDPPTTD
jgi:hypothetical protein